VWYCQVQKWHLLFSIFYSSIPLPSLIPIQWTRDSNVSQSIRFWHQTSVLWGRVNYGRTTLFGVVFDGKWFEVQKKMWFENVWWFLSCNKKTKIFLHFVAKKCRMFITACCKTVCKLMVVVFSYSSNRHKSTFPKHCVLN
jgi:hypothetical protein